MPPPPDPSAAEFSTDLSTPLWLTVALATPALKPLHYGFTPAPQQKAPRPAVGQWVLGPLGRRTLLGLITEVHDQDPGEIPADRVRPVHALLPDFPALSPKTIDLYAFVSRYYRRPLGAVIATAVPPYLRVARHHIGAKTPALVDRLTRTGLAALQPASQSLGDAAQTTHDAAPVLPPLTTAQAQALHSIAQTLAQPLRQPVLLHGVTGSGKTRVYMEAMRLLWQADPTAQVLLLVPEIGLTPALEMRMRAAFPDIPQTSLHSSMTDVVRAQSWIWASTGKARLVIGTRLAVLTPLPALAMIVVDEEHDASYKQQEGLRYSARDLAVYRGQQENLLVLLGSATPSLETLYATERGNYQRLHLPHQATGAARAVVRLVDTLQDPAIEGLSQATRLAISEALGAGSHVLVFLNRRGWAPVLGCEACPWTAVCQHCTTATVLHKQKDQWRLICHHCGAHAPVPTACPDCGASDLSPIGRGIQRIEAALQKAYPQTAVKRIDRDTVRSAKQMAEALATTENAPPLILVGTQMMAKGHDLPGLDLVVVADADPQLIHPDFRAPEWLLSVLVQVAGRAGRHTQHHRTAQPPAQVLIQTRYPQHPLFQALLHDRPDQYAQSILEDRRAAGLPPFAHMAMVRLSDVRQDRLEAGSRALHRHLNDWLRGRQAEPESTARISGKKQDDSWLNAHAYPPAPDYPERQGLRLRWHMVLETPTRQQRAALAHEVEAFSLRYPGLDVQIEIDPLSQT